MRRILAKLEDIVDLRLAKTKTTRRHNRENRQEKPPERLEDFSIVERNKETTASQEPYLNKKAVDWNRRLIKARPF